ncbi:hypothetical protein SAMN05661080_03325 [Modestobacter sp. DSM 44400]|nr:hypothetical protein SAMN05661080_03325 [Modestobacter sp. DSM 44400]
MSYARLTDGLQPACATACPTQSIQFGNLDELQARADARLATLQGQGVETARLYGRDTDDGVGGAGAFFLLLDEPEVCGLPQVIGALGEFTQRPQLTKVAHFAAAGGALASVGLLIVDPGPADAVPAHAAGVPADVAAVGGLLHPVAVQRADHVDGGAARAAVIPPVRALKVARFIPACARAAQWLPRSSAR